MINIAFLDQLASARSDVDFARTAAGFAVLQVYDSVKSNGYDPAVHLEVLKRLEREIAALGSAPRLRASLVAMVQVLPFWNSDGYVRVGRQATYTALLTYGQALGDEGEWTIAESVYSLVGLDAELDGETWLAAEARLLMGRASRQIADWESSRIAYQRAYELGLESGDPAIAVRARIGEANNLWVRGDFPGARQLLKATERLARKICPQVLPRVTLALAGVANAAGEYERAIQIAFDLVQSLDDDHELAHAALVDLAIFLTDYGLPPVAAAALRMVERSAPERRIRMLARLNLFFLAAHHESEVEFDERREQLRAEPLTVRDTVQVALFSAQGLRRFGRLAEARSEADRAAELANRYEQFQLAFEAEAEAAAISKSSIDADGAPDVRGIHTLPVETESFEAVPHVQPEERQSWSDPAGWPRGIRRVAESLTTMSVERFAPFDVEADWNS